MKLSKTLQRIVVFKQKLLDLGVKVEDIKFDIRPGGNVWAGVRQEESKYLYFDLFGYVSSSSEKDFERDLNKVSEYFFSLSEEKRNDFIKKNSDFYVTSSNQYFDAHFLPSILMDSKIYIKNGLN